MGNTYADYELDKLGGHVLTRVKFVDDSGETRWISITPETLDKIRAVLSSAPECSWEA